MSNAKPLLNVATVCEKILHEKNDVLSLIRMVDTFFIPHEALQTPDAVLPVVAFIGLKSGDFKGEGELSLAIETPDGIRTEHPEKFPMLFVEPHQGNNVVLNMGLKIRHIGTSWLSVLWNGELLTKFPIRLAHPLTDEPLSSKN